MRLIVALLFVALSGPIYAATCQELWDGTAGISDLDENIACLSWAIPPQNDDGSDLDPALISAFLIYYGKNAADLDQLARVEVGTATGYELAFGCEIAMWHFELTAEKTVLIPATEEEPEYFKVNESVRSKPVSKRFVCVPAADPPTEFKVQFKITQL